MLLLLRLLLSGPADLLGFGVKERDATDRARDKPGEPLYETQRRVSCAHAVVVVSLLKTEFCCDEGEPGRQGIRVFGLSVAGD